MIIFCPYRTCMQCVTEVDNDPIIVNFTSMNQSLPRLGYLMPNLPMDQFGSFNDADYFAYVMGDQNAFMQLMSIMIPLYEGKDVFVCITPDSNNQYINGMNEMLMGFIQTRYGYLPTIVNDPEDFISFSRSDFKFSLQGIMNFDQDRERWVHMVESARLRMGGKPYYEE